MLTSAYRWLARRLALAATALTKKSIFNLRVGAMAPLIRPVGPRLTKKHFCL
jgi:hypothetical protein